eukprot:7296998-Alexandrium_andersonii.AAC.1
MHMLILVHARWRSHTCAVRGGSSLSAMTVDMLICSQSPHRTLKSAMMSSKNIGFGSSDKGGGAATTVLV